MIKEYEVNTWGIISNCISLLADVLTIVVGVITLYLVIWKRKKISAVVKGLMNYAFQLTISDLKSKLDSLNKLSMEDEKTAKEAIGVFHDILGQIKGNPKLHSPLVSEFYDKLEKVLKLKKPIEDTRKRALVSELREILRYINVENVDDNMGGKP
jgi:hypothetical protein